MSAKQIKGEPIATDVGEILPGFNDTVNGKKITSSSICMGYHCGDATVKHNGKTHKIRIVGGLSGGTVLNGPNRTFVVRLEKIIDHAIAHGLLDDVIAFKPETRRKRKP